ncbi:MAG: hypothetical protein M3Q30_13235 [Actinomycetota bacterium]|nr:hypothetical protein [Actinomycetota bacterium]
MRTLSIIVTRLLRKSRKTTGETSMSPGRLTAALLVALTAFGAVGLSATAASATVGDWNTDLVRPYCSNTADGGWWDFSDLVQGGGGLSCFPGETKAFSATSESSTVWLDQTITRWTYNYGWHTTTLSSVRYFANCGTPNLSTLNVNNGDCSVVGHSDTWWHGPRFCNYDYVVPYCGDIHVDADDQNFVILPGSVYQVQKKAWWLSGGRWVPKTVSYWMTDKGVIYNTQKS